MEHATDTTNPTTTGSTVTLDPGPLAADDPRLVFAHAVATAGAVIARTAPDQLDLTTPCDQFDVRTLLGHLVAVLGRVTVLGRGEPAMSAPQIVTGVADDHWSNAWRSAAHGVQSVWQDDALLEGTYVLPWATKTGPELLLTYASEVSVHTWDLARATGQEVTWHEPTLAAAYENMVEALPGEGRVAAFAAFRAKMPPPMRDAPAPFDEVVQVAADAPMIDRLVAWNGRRPDWQR